MTLDLEMIRRQFPSIQRPVIFFDNPGGTQIAQQSLDRINKYLLECNSNHNGSFPISRASDELLHEAHAAAADFLNAARPEEIVFSLNMTTHTFNISRSLAKRLSAGDEIVVTKLDHDANVTPWVLLAQDAGCKITFIDFDVEDCTLNMDQFEKAMARKPKIVAMGYASNLVGTINPVKKLTKMAKDAGALVYIDAVQYAPHGSIDVQDIGCDFLACSAYKFFGPHVGILYGRYDLLDELMAYKVRPAPQNPPGKFEQGTPNHEGISGVLGALEYFEWIGGQFAGPQMDALKEKGFSGRKLKLHGAMTAIRAYEMELSRALIETIVSIPGNRIYGISEMKRLDERVPTVSFRNEKKHPNDVAVALADAGINVWDGHSFAVEAVAHLGIADTGGVVRVGAAHYNTLEEVARFGEVLKKILL